MLREWYNRIRVQLFFLRHRGRRYRCPICGYHSDLMLPLGHDTEASHAYEIIGGGRRNAVCLKCNSTDRERLIYLYLKDYVHAFDRKELSILHIAPEPHIASAFIKRGFSKYLCGDLFTEDYQYPDYVQHMDVLDLPVESNRFDLVICNHVLEHIPNDRQAMSELYRVLKPSGLAILQVPISLKLEHSIEDFSIEDPEKREQLFGQKNHCRLYGKDYITRLTDSGFVVNTVSLSSEYYRYAINPNEKIFVCTKSLP